MSQTLMFYVIINELNMSHEQFNSCLSHSHSNYVQLIDLFEYVIKSHYRFLKLCRNNRVILHEHIRKHNEILLNRLVFTITNSNLFYFIIKNSEIGYIFQSLLKKLYQCKEMHQSVSILIC
jgi:hypothetical protein